MTRNGAAAAIALAAFLMLCGGLGRADLFNPDEPREAEIAREMLVSGDFVVPHLNGEPFLEKPPLFYWLVVPAFRLAGGPGEWPARVVPAVCGWLAVLLVMMLGADLVGARAARLAAIILLTSQQFFWTSRRCMIDMPLTLAVLLACLAFYRALAGRGGTVGRRPAWLLLGTAATGAAVLLKGAVGGGIPALVIFGVLALRRDGPGLARLAAALVAASVPLGLWVAGLHARLGSQGVREFLWVNNVLRFIGGAAKGHAQPFYYYLPTLLIEMAPWSLLLPAAVAAAWWAARSDSAQEERAADERSGASGQRDPAAVRFILIWLLAPLCLLSLASTKRGIYLLPIYPAAALLLGWWIDRLASAGTGVAAGPPGSWRSARVTARLSLIALLVASLLICAILPAAIRLVRPGDRTAFVLAFIPMLAGAYLGGVALRRGAFRRLAGVAGAGLAAVTLGVALAVVPPVIEIISPRPAADFLARLLAARDRVVLYRFKEGALGGILFYTGSTLPNLKTPEELRLRLASDGAPSAAPRTLGLMRQEIYRADAERFGLATAVVKRFAAPSFDPAALIGAPAGPSEEALVLVTAAPQR